MATTSAKIVTLLAGEDFTAADYALLVKLENDGGVAKAVKVTAAADDAIGVYSGGKEDDGNEVSIWHIDSSEIVVCRAQEAITAGELE